MKFADIIGQSALSKQIINLIQEGRMPHAIMLTGAEGVGKLPIAIATAQYLCCENPSNEDSCGVCPSCVKFAKLAHPDLHFTFPFAKSETNGIRICDDIVQDFRNANIENPYINLQSWLNYTSDGKTGTIYRQEGNEIIRKLSMKPYESKHQVMIIWALDRMNDECANHILKFLEEPPANTFFICITTKEEDVLKTINSRTQKIYVPPISFEDMFEHANSTFNLPKANLEHIVRLARGSWSKFLSEISSEDVQKELFQMFVVFMRVSWTLNMKDLRNWAEKMASLNRDKQKIFLQLAQNQIRENFITRLKSPELQYMNQQETDFAAKFSRFIHENNIEDMMAELQLAEEQIEQNINSKIIFFHLPFILYRLIKRTND